jgi:hypothetical protein
MRINLRTPFAEKDAVKALGARWDAAKKVWYITDVADLSPFARWIPDMEGATENPTPTTKPIIEVPHCGCNVLPWEDCEHTATPPGSTSQT